MLEATRQYALEKLEERGERNGVAAPPHARASSASRRASIAIGTTRRSVRGFARRRPSSTISAPRSDGRSANVTICARGVFSPARSRGSGIRSLPRGTALGALAIDSVTEKTQADELAQLYIAEAELSGALGESAASLAAAEQALRLRSVLDELQVARAEHAAGSALAATGRASEGEAYLQRRWQRPSALRIAGCRRSSTSDLGTASFARRRCRRRLAAFTPKRWHVTRRSASSGRPHRSPGISPKSNLQAGDAAAALHRAEEARAGHAATQNRRSEAVDLRNMTAYLVALDCFDDARAYASQALEAARDVRAPVLIAYALQHVAAIAALHGGSSDPATGVAAGEGDDAARLRRFAAAIARRLRDYTERQEYDRVVTALRTRSGERFDELMALGERWGEEAAVALAFRLAQP